MGVGAMLRPEVSDFSMGLPDTNHQASWHGLSRRLSSRVCDRTQGGADSTRADCESREVTWKGPGESWKGDRTVTSEHS